jgi:hypothetical protein
MTVKGAGHTEFCLDAHDPSLHLIELTGWFRIAVNKPRRLVSFARLRIPWARRSQCLWITSAPRRTDLPG